MTITDAEILKLWREQVRANEGEPTIADVTQFARDLIHWHDTRQGREAMGPWQAAIDDALIAHCLDCTGPDSDPCECVSRLLRSAEAMALDPAISERAQALIERGRLQASDPEAAPPAEFVAALREAARYLLAEGKRQEGIAVQACVTMLEDDGK